MRETKKTVYVADDGTEHVDLESAVEERSRCRQDLQGGAGVVASRRSEERGAIQDGR